MLTTILNGEPSYSWGEYVIQSGRIDINTSPQVTGMSAVLSNWKLFWFQQHIDKNFGLPETVTPMGQVDVPTLLIGAERDRLVPSAASIKLICSKYGYDGSSVFRSFIADAVRNTLFDTFSRFVAEQTRPLTQR